jgi:hypothetical protein
MMAHTWFRRATDEFDLDASRLTIDLSLLLDHPIKKGARFDADSTEEGRQSIIAHLTNADILLARFAQLEGATKVRLWPSPFAIAVTVTPPGDKRPSIAIGLSTGDADCPQPFYYVIPPPPLSPTIVSAPLPAGRWRTEGRGGAILTATDIAKADHPAEQAAMAETFLRAAYLACVSSVS